MAFLCKESSTLRNCLESDDTETCRIALEAIKKTGNLKRINCRDSGIVTRFLLPICAALGGEYYFDGSPRMRERPIAPLIDILQEQNVSFEFLESSKKMPFKIRSSGLIGGKMNINIQDSSQFLSGLLIAAPLSKQGITIQVNEKISTKPYVQMTLHLMQRFGITYQLVDDFTIHIAPNVYHATDLTIEPDASTASYFFAAAALTQRSITIMNLNAHSIQGDLKFLEVLVKIGCSIKATSHAITVTGTTELKSIGEINMSGFSDTFMTLAVIAPFLPTPTTIHGLKHTRLQESDRVASMAEELKRVCIKTESTEDSLTIFPGIPQATQIQSHHDHRIAMSFAILGLKIPEIQIIHPECVSKTCPSFFKLLSELFESKQDY